MVIEKHDHRIDWRIALGLVMSAIWLGLGVAYIQSNYGWALFVKLPLDQMGDFLGGAFGPLAFLWLVIGFFIQQSEINQNTRGIEIQAHHNNLDNFLKVSSIIQQQMGVILGMLFVSSQGIPGKALVDSATMTKMWNRASEGDFSVFARSFLTMRFDDQGNALDIRDLFFLTEIRRRHTANFLRIFDNLLEEAKECDPQESIREAMLQGTAFGLLYQYIKSLEVPNYVETTAQN